MTRLTHSERPPAPDCPGCPLDDYGIERRACRGVVEPTWVPSEHLEAGGSWWAGRWCVDCEADWNARQQVARTEEGQDAAGIPARLRPYRFARNLIQRKAEPWDDFRARLDRAALPTIGITGWNVERARAVRDRPKGRSLVISGPVGAGKSLLAACLANDMIERGIGVLWLSEAALWERHAREQVKGAQRRVVAATMAAPLLFLDDLGATEKLTAWHRDHLEALICGRYDRTASVVITTNLPLTAPEKVDSIASVYGERVLSRLVDLVGGRRAGLPGYLELRGMDWRSDLEHGEPEAPPEPTPKPRTVRPPRADWQARAANDRTNEGPEDADA